MRVCSAYLSDWSYDWCRPAIGYGQLQIVDLFSPTVVSWLTQLGTVTVGSRSPREPSSWATMISGLEQSCETWWLINWTYGLKLWLGCNWIMKFEQNSRIISSKTWIFVFLRGQISYKSTHQNIVAMSGKFAKIFRVAHSSSEECNKPAVGVIFRTAH